MVGNTEVGIEMKFKDARYPVLIGATHVPELNKVRSHGLAGWLDAVTHSQQCTPCCAPVVAARLDVILVSCSRHDTTARPPFGDAPALKSINLLIFPHSPPMYTRIAHTTLSTCFLLCRLTRQRRA